MSINSFFVLIFIINNAFGVSMNQPHISSCALWNTNATTIANESAVGQYPGGIFITTRNSIYVNDRQNNRILLSNNGSWTPIMIDHLINLGSIFITDNDEIIVDNGYAKGRVDKWSLNGTSCEPVMYTNSSCTGLFVDIINDLYCLSTNQHRVVKQIGLNANKMLPMIVAGTGCAGPTADKLDHPLSIFVDKNLNLYVADTDNNRVQRFESGQLNAITVAGFGASVFFLLNRPTSIILDGNESMFIADSQNHRIIRSVSNEFQCLFGCSVGRGASENQLNSPQTIAFDKDGNLFVADSNNHRIQKFHLMKNACATTATTTTAAALPLQCSTYTTITDGTRRISSATTSILCDSGFTATGTWVRFSGAAGTMLASSSPGMNRCNTQATGYYTGIYPAIGSTASGPVCYHWASGTCYLSNSILVSNCNGYYVYHLVAPPGCNLRYCTQ